MYFYVTDERGRLTGDIPTRRLLASDLHAPIESLMVTSVVTLPSSVTVRDACDAFLQHRFLAFPVVDRDGRLEGIVDVHAARRQHHEHGR
ncbi:MAG TPA: CBS domain-containing protein, partial [Gemmatimonadaceae bacterium]|nr:CBS domain-containing protein [Gemmatimonadaceae bacterium]